MNQLTLKYWEFLNYKIGFRATIVRIACALHNFNNPQKIVHKERNNILKNSTALKHIFRTKYGNYLKYLCVYEQ